MIMETERLILRPWEEADAKLLYEFAKDPLVGPAAGWPVHTSVENSRELIRDVLSAPETYAVVIKEKNIPVGSVGIMPTRATHPDVKAYELEIGYWIGVPYWGNGFIPEAVERLLEHCFKDMNCPGVWCGYYEGNAKSKRVQEKCGFEFHHTEMDKNVDLLSDIRTEHYTYMSKEKWNRKRL